MALRGITVNVVVLGVIELRFRPSAFAIWCRRNGGMG